MSPDQKGIETFEDELGRVATPFTMSPDQKGIETRLPGKGATPTFTMSPDQKGIETIPSFLLSTRSVHNEPRSKGD